VVQVSCLPSKSVSAVGLSENVANASSNSSAPPKRPTTDHFVIRGDGGNLQRSFPVRWHNPPRGRTADIAPISMPHPHRDFENLRLFEHPLIQQKLTRARHRETPSMEFRRLLNEIAGLMTFEISRQFPTHEVEVLTPMETTTGTVLSQPVTLVPILRAGIGMTDGILALIPEARVGHIGIYRDESSLMPVDYYAKFPPDIADGPVLLVDPMLATGGSSCHAVSELKTRGCRDIKLICLVCAPEGVQRMLDTHPEVTVYAAALDRELNEHGYILPGLGDAGDRIFGTA
jgi:uracil phosphoribosyltransferase